MKRKIAQTVALLVACSMLTFLFLPGCSSSPAKETVQTTKQGTAAATTTAAAVTTAATTLAGDKIVSSPLTLTYWSRIDQKVSNFATDYNQLVPFIELEKLTGIHIEFWHPPVGQETEQLNIMLASGVLPDMIYHNWSSLPGGAAKAISDKIIVKLNDLVSASAPNLKKVYEKYPDAKLGSMLDDGSLYMMPFIKPDVVVRSVNGFTIRQDWLETLKVDKPTTIAQWYTVLKAIKDGDPNKNGKKDEIPFVLMKSAIVGNTALARFSGAWKIGLGFYLKDGKVRFGLAEPEYKEYLTEMRKWYQEGLIDSEFSLTDQKQFDAKITGNLAGSYYGLASGNLGRYMNSMMPTQPGFVLAPVAWPATTDGKKYAMNPGMITSIDGGGIAITAKSKRMTEAIKWCDFQYGEKGNMLVNFGIEGKSYTLVGGQPVYTDEVMKNKDGLTPDQAVAKYALTFGSSMTYDTRYFTQILTLPQQKEAIKIWADADTSMLIPSSVAPKADESSKLATMTNEINTYASEMFTKFIMGQEPLTNFDKYLERIKAMGVADASAIMQSAYDRYLVRK